MEPSKKKRALWSETQLQDALAAVDRGMPVRTASVTFKIPRRTIRNHVSSGKTKKSWEDHLTYRLIRKKNCVRGFLDWRTLVCH